MIKVETQYKKIVFLKSKLSEVRCRRCGRLLFCGIVEEVEIKCPRCKTVQMVGGRKQRRKNKCRETRGSEV
ncbi:Com family DNA-binding transcriptional regulator [Dendrosporobacter quercicolus]|uniref:Com family DNA-binding transcriptional regulator n=1 Tax=Dendrosporobacter quercicolus TaxID=146817 RepID=UPI0030EDD5F2